MPTYIKCPKCALNYITKAEKMCSECFVQTKAINTDYGTLRLDLAGKTELLVGDNIYFSTIAEAINSVFGTTALNYYRSWFTPIIFSSLGLSNYKVWFPLAPSVGNSDYKNILSEEGSIITEEFLTAVKGYPTDNDRITFYAERHTDSKRYYRFVGIFKFGGLEGKARKWIRVQDRIKIY